MTDGFLIVDKPAGITSHQVVARVRRALGTKKVGHAGTLDPLATGVMILCTGRATKRIEEFQQHTKEYIATLKIGAGSLQYSQNIHLKGWVSKYRQLSREVNDE